MTLGDFLLGLVTLYILLCYFALLFGVLDDLFKDPEMSGMGKLGWILFLLLLPIVGLVVYGIRRGQGMTERSMARTWAKLPQQRSDVGYAGGDYDGVPATHDDPSAQIARAHELLLTGAVTKSEYDSMKAKALAS